MLSILELILPSQGSHSFTHLIKIKLTPHCIYVPTPSKVLSQAVRKQFAAEHFLPICLRFKEAH